MLLIPLVGEEVRSVKEGVSAAFHEGRDRGAAYARSGYFEKGKVGVAAVCMCAW